MGRQRGTADTAPLVLAPRPESAGAARRYVRGALAALRRPDLEAAATLGVSELVTNAALHARTPITVIVRATGAGQVRVEVTDRSPAPPRTRTYGVTAATGRGLRLVASVARDWGVEPVAGGPGKTVWFEPGADAEIATAR